MLNYFHFDFSGSREKINPGTLEKHACGAISAKYVACCMFYNTSKLKCPVSSSFLSKTDQNRSIWLHFIMLVVVYIVAVR